MKIGIVGVGMVGETLQYGFNRLGHDLALVDTKWPNTKLTDVRDCELTFVCVPTPCSENGQCDISSVEKVVGELASMQPFYRGLIVIKSTVTPGTTSKLIEKHRHARIAFCPEFLRERARYSDFVENHETLIIGAVRPEHFQTIWQAHGSLPKKAIWMPPLEAELAKYFVNIYNAMRITFANQFFEVCEAAGANYTVVKNAVVQRQSIGDHYLECNRHFRQFGGNCLPKDAKAFLHYARSIGAAAQLFETMLAINEELSETKAVLHEAERKAG